MHGDRPKRTWQQIAEEASHEKDPERLLQLIKELEQALDERDKPPAETEAGKAKKHSG